MTPKYLILLILLNFCIEMAWSQSFSSRFNMNQWPTDQVKRARDKANTHSLCSQREKDVIFYCNLVRINGPLFEKTILKEFLASDKFNVDTSYSNSLIKELINLPIDKLPLFSYDEILFKVSKKFAVTGGKKGILGHDGFDERLEPVSKNHYCVAENCSYGLEDAFDAFILLLIDEGVPSLGHRKNILKPDFVYASAAFAPHKTYRVNLVMNFACEVMKEN